MCSKLKHRPAHGCSARCYWRPNRGSSAPRKTSTSLQSRPRSPSLSVHNEERRCLAVATISNFLDFTVHPGGVTSTGLTHSVLNRHPAASERKLDELSRRPASRPSGSICPDGGRKSGLLAEYVRLRKALQPGVPHPLFYLALHRNASLQDFGTLSLAYMACSKIPLSVLSSGSPGARPPLGLRRPRQLSAGRPRM